MRATDSHLQDYGNGPLECFTAPDVVEEASEDSFPASDAPAYTPATALGPPDDVLPVPGPEPAPPEEVREHPLSDPSSRSAAP